MCSLNKWGKAPQFIEMYRVDELGKDCAAKFVKLSYLVTDSVAILDFSTNW
jgi:hypothetical protein